MNKENIPNYLTLTRIVCTPIIIILGLLNKANLVIILAIICALTDLFDGKLARKWNVVSEKGAKLDVIADKVFGIGLLLSLITFNSKLLFPLIFEMIISITNLYYYYILNKTESLMIGKIKTTTLFLTIISCMINVYFEKTLFITNGLISATLNLQFLCVLFYYNNFLVKREILNSSVEDTIAHKKIIYDVENELDDKTIEVTNIVDLANQYKKNEN